MEILKDKMADDKGELVQGSFDDLIAPGPKKGVVIVKVESGNTTMSYSPPGPRQPRPALSEEAEQRRLYDASRKPSVKPWDLPPQALNKMRKAVEDKKS